MNRDTKIQDLIFEFNRNEKALGSFNIQIKFWEDICSLQRLSRNYFKILFRIPY